MAENLKIRLVIYHFELVCNLQLLAQIAIQRRKRRFPHFLSQSSSDIGKCTNKLKSSRHIYG